MHRSAVTQQGEVDRMFVSCDLAVLTLDGGEFRVLVQRPLEGHRPLTLPSALMETGQGPTVTVTRLARALGAPRPTRVHQLGVPGTELPEPGSDTLVLGWMLLTPHPWEVGEGLQWLSRRELAEADLATHHRQIIAEALERLGNDIEITLLATELCERTFTLAQLREVYEVVWQVNLDAANFHRKFTSLTGALVPTGEQTRGTRGRPATLYRAGRLRRLPQRISRPEPEDRVAAAFSA